jgi:hypothetical protein
LVSGVVSRAIENRGTFWIQSLNESTIIQISRHIVMFWPYEWIRAGIFFAMLNGFIPGIEWRVDKREPIQTTWLMPIRLDRRHPFPRILIAVGTLKRTNVPFSNTIS